MILSQAGFKILLVVLVVSGFLLGPGLIIFNLYHNSRLNSIYNDTSHANIEHTDVVDIVNPIISEFFGYTAQVVDNHTSFSLVYDENEDHFMNLYQIDFSDDFSTILSTRIFEDILPRIIPKFYWGLAFDGGIFYTLQQGPAIRDNVYTYSLIEFTNSEILTNISIPIQEILEHPKFEQIGANEFNLKLLGVEGNISVISIQSRPKGMQGVGLFDLGTQSFVHLYRSEYRYNSAINMDEQGTLWFYYVDTEIQGRMLDEGYFGYKFANIKNIESTNMDRTIILPEGTINQGSRQSGGIIDNYSVDYYVFAEMIFNDRIFTAVQGLQLDNNLPNYFVGYNISTIFQLYSINDDLNIIIVGFILFVSGIFLLRDVKTDETGQPDENPDIPYISTNSGIQEA